MKRFGILETACVLAAFALFFSSCGAQTSSNSSHAAYQATPLPANAPADSYKTRPVPSVQILTPFSIDALPSASAQLIEFRSENEITEQDRELATNAEPSIREGAELAGIEFDQGKWADQQLVCPALPGHLFLLFKWDNGAGDVSLFSAAIPRQGPGRVRIIPIQRRGFSLFSPAAVNALTIATFNRIRADEPGNNTADWLSIALCYASLAGAHPQTSPLPGKSADADLALSFPPTLEVGGSGESTVRFVDVTASRPAMQWTLTFNSKGQLLRVIKIATPEYVVHPVPPLPTELSSTHGTQ